jgi:probable HAF family extracellular repeat protein
MRVNLAVLVLLSPLASTWAQTSPTYQLTDLGTLGGTACPDSAYGGGGKSSFARALNERGQVAGASCAPNFLIYSSFHAFRWSVGAMTNLGTLGLGNPDSSVAYGINDAVRSSARLPARGRCGLPRSGR